MRVPVRRARSDQVETGAPVNKRIHLRASLVAMAALATGCSSLPEDDTGAVAAALNERGLEWHAPADGGAPAELLAKPMTRTTALQVALQNNPELRAQLARLGFAAADVYEAGRLSNPRLSVSVLFPDRGDQADQV